MNDLWILLLAVAVFVFLGVAARSVRGGSRWTSIRSSVSPEAQLLLLCRGDAERAERLIELEKRRAPRLSRERAVVRALERFRKDNR